MSKFFYSLVFLTAAMAACAGCGEQGNTVIQPSAGEATAEEIAEYEQEQEEMEAERD